MKFRTGRLSLASCMVALLFLAGACSSNGTSTSGSLQNETLQLDFTWVPDHIPYMWAVAKGYYKDAGLNVQLVQGQGSATTMTLVGTGKDPFGWGDLGTAALEIGKGVPIKTITVLTRRTPFGTECFKNVHFTGPKSLIGHTVNLIPQESLAQIWPAYLRANRVNPSQVHIVSASFANKFTLFIQHRADCMPDYYGIGLDIARAANPDIGQPISWEQDGIHTLSQGLVVNNAFAQAHPSIVKAFVAASIRGWKAACANIPAAMALYEKEHPLQNKTAADRQLNTTRLRYECASTVPLPGTGATRFGPTTAAEWAPMISILHRYGGLTITNPASLFTNQYLP